VSPTAGSIRGVAPDAQTLRLTVDLEIASEPIRGSVDDGTGSVIDFAGWLELMSAFERATAKAAVDTDQPQGGRR
jgi:hypothetical protein